MAHRGDWYILIDKKPVKTTLAEWSRFMKDTDRHVDQTKIGEHWVSTVFLGRDHGWGSRPLILFETMIFGPDGKTIDYQTRCSTWAQAERMHAAALKYVRQEVST